MKKYISLFLISVIFIINACTTPNISVKEDKKFTPTKKLEVPRTGFNEELPYSPEQITRGEYLIAILGCSNCHTDGALVGSPNYLRHLAGSNTGIAYTNQVNQINPGVVYPPNLTPDMETGIGSISDEAIVQQIRMGLRANGGHTVPVMPWPEYSELSNDDVNSIVAYLRSLPAIYHKVPNNILPGNSAEAPYVHFGVYQKLR